MKEEKMDIFCVAVGDLCRQNAVLDREARCFASYNNIDAHTARSIVYEFVIQPRCESVTISSHRRSRNHGDLCVALVLKSRRNYSNWRATT